MRGDAMQRFIVLLAMIFSMALPASADDRAEHGDWTSQFLDGMGEASTHENGMSMLGMLCGNGSCRYYFANGLDCEPSVNYPLMLTTDVGAVSIEAVCEPMNTSNGEVMLYWFSETPYLNEAFVKTPVIGIAFPLTNGEFKTSKFSMNGFAQAIERMVTIMRDSTAADVQGLQDSQEVQEPPEDQEQQEARQVQESEQPEEAQQPEEPPEPQENDAPGNNSDLDRT